MVDGCYSAAAADHDESLDVAGDGVDGAVARAVVLEFANGAFEVDRRAEGNGVEGLAHLAAGARSAGKVDFHEDVHGAFLGRGGDGRVAADEGLVRCGGGEADHQVLAGGEAEVLMIVVEFEGEDARVPGHWGFGVEGCFLPFAWVEEGLCGLFCGGVLIACC